MSNSALVAWLKAWVGTKTAEKGQKRGKERERVKKVVHLKDRRKMVVPKGRRVVHLEGRRVVYPREKMAPRVGKVITQCLDNVNFKGIYIG